MRWVVRLFVRSLRRCRSGRRDTPASMKVALLRVPWWWWKRVVEAVVVKVEVALLVVVKESRRRQ